MIQPSYLLLQVFPARLQCITKTRIYPNTTPAIPSPSHVLHLPVMHSSVLSKTLFQKRPETWYIPSQGLRPSAPAALALSIRLKCCVSFENVKCGGKCSLTSSSEIKWMWFQFTQLCALLDLFRSLNWPQLAKQRAENKALSSLYFVTSC